MRTERINTVVVSDAARALGVRLQGAAALEEEQLPRVLGELADLLATGAIELPIAAT